MPKIKNLLDYFTKGEWLLWGLSALFVVLSFLLLDRDNCLTMTASLIGVTAILFNAKGNPFGQLLMIAFSLIYGYISLSCAYYGEMITYLGMTAPMALFALISWLRHPFRGNRAQVTVNKITRREALWMSLLTVGVTVAFHFILRVFDTANLAVSTLSVTTSFLAVYLTFRRSEYFSLAYAANDVVLLVLWGVAAARDASYLSVLVCFVAFLANDVYCFANWRRMHRHQRGMEK